MQKNKIPILMYHSICRMPKGTLMRGLNVPKSLFFIQMLILKLFGFKGVSINKLLPYLKGDIKGKVVGITFDDGYQNLIENALPVLNFFKISATCYVVSDEIGKFNSWDTPKGLPYQKLMNQEEIQIWINNQMELGSHSHKHERLGELDFKYASEQIIKSKNDLEKKFRVKVNNFCFPYGSYTNRLINFVEETGYKSATTTNRGRATSNANLFELPRIPITHRTYPHSLLLKIFTEYEDRKKQT